VEKGANRALAPKSAISPRIWGGLEG